MTIFVGVDPGLSGAAAFIDETGKLLKVDDAPSLEIKSGNKMRRKYLVARMAEIIRFNCAGCSQVNFVLEQVHSMPGQGVAAMFSMGYGLGLWDGIMTAYCCWMGGNGKLHYVTPQAWKKVMLEGMDKGTKDSSRLKAQQLFPTAELHLKKHDGRADALLIAEYGRRTFNVQQ